MSTPINGTTSPAAKMSRLEELNGEFQAQKTAPTKKEQAELVATWKRAVAAQKKAEEALQAAQHTVSQAAADVIRRCSGKKNVKFDGETWVPMSRGDTVFFRRLGSQEVVDLG